VLKSTLSMAWGLLGLFGFIGILMGGIVLYKKSRTK